MKTTLDNFCDDIWSEIEKWSIEASIMLSDAVLDTTVQAQKDIKKITPKGAKRWEEKNYRDCFKIKPSRSRNRNLMDRTLWNSQYQLSHLLEDGHEVYTRLGKKTNPNARKIGPLEIKKRSAKNGGTFAVFTDNKHTVKYGNWIHTRELAEQNLVNEIKTKFR